MKSYSYQILLLALMSLVANVAMAGYNITITPSTFPVCVGETVSVTAEVRTELGYLWQGNFEWSYFKDGNWELIGQGLYCPPPGSSSSSSSINFVWATPGLSSTLRVRYIPYAVPGCPITEKTQALFVQGLPGVPSTGYKELAFCSPNQTRTVTIPGINCPAFSGYGYEWLVPAGWTIVPNGGYPYTTIPGGISTGSTSVSITAPGSLQQRYDGNYVITVRTPSGYIYSAQSQGTIWVGTPDVPGSLIGNSTPPSGSTQQYRTPSQAPGAGTITWILPYGSGWSPVSYPNDLTIRALVGTGPGNVQAVGTNTCGQGGASVMWVVPTGGGGCNPCPRIAAPEISIPAEEIDAVADLTVELSPNPTGSLVTITGRGHGLRSGVVQFVDARGVPFRLDGTLQREGVLIVNCETLADGLYVVDVETEKGLVRKKVLKVR